MAASPSSVISLGFGSWGSVNLVPTLGYGAGVVVAVVSSPGIEITATDGRLHITQELDRFHFTVATSALHYTVEEEDTL